jgi:hypothetical protein
MVPKIIQIQGQGGLRALVFPLDIGNLLIQNTLPLHSLGLKVALLLKFRQTSWGGCLFWLTSFLTVISMEALAWQQEKANWR